MKTPAYGHGPWLVAMGACVVGIVSIMLFACSEDNDPLYDLAGNRYPPECTIAATIAEPASRTPVEPRVLAGFPKHHVNDHVLGVTFTSSNTLPAIWYDKTLRGWALTDALRHEGCHAMKYRLTGNSQWHG